VVVDKTTEDVNSEDEDDSDNKGSIVAAERMIQVLQLQVRKKCNKKNGSAEIPTIDVTPAACKEDPLAKEKSEGEKPT